MATAHDEIIQLEGQLVTHYVRTLGAPTDNTYSDQSVTFTAADDQVRLLMGALNPDWSHDHTGQRLDELQTFAMMESTSPGAKGDYLHEVRHRDNLPLLQRERLRGV